MPAYFIVDNEGSAGDQRGFDPCFASSLLLTRRPPFVPTWSFWEGTPRHGGSISLQPLRMR